MKVLKNLKFQNAGAPGRASAAFERRQVRIKSKKYWQIILMNWTLSQSTETCCCLATFQTNLTLMETSWSEDARRQRDNTRIPEWLVPWKYIALLMILLMTHDDTKQSPIRQEPESDAAAVQTNLENRKCCFEFSAKKKEKTGSSGLHLVWEMDSKWLRWITVRQLQ